MLTWSGDIKPGHPYWWDGADMPDFPDTAPLRTDILIIGAGYTGLSAAIAAHDAGASVAVVDAALPGSGASTRNGGMFGAHPRLGWQVLADTFGKVTADALFAEATPAMQYAKGLIEKEKIQCDLYQTGRIQLAYTAAQFDVQKQLAAHVAAKSDVRVHMVERADLKQEINTETYFGGIVFPEHYGLHPRKFHNGLLAATLARGIPVAAHCPITKLERTLGGFRAITPGGTIDCEKVILATNGYTPNIFRWFQRRVFPLPSYIITTEPLDPKLIDHLAPGRRMMVETRARHSYFRISPDGTRILFGGRSSMCNIDPVTAAKRLRQTMLEIWPDLSDVRITHSWTGNTGYSFSGMPQVGEQDGLHYAMGFSGSGTVMAPYLGAKAGLRAAGGAGGETAYSDTRFKTSWLHPTSHPHFLKAADIWYRTRVDQQDRHARRR